jgi:glycosyltransferase involved in cell wall biosynthesis
MKILWIVNTIFPAPSKTLGLPEPVFGGWMYGLAEQISISEGIELAVATTYSGSKLKEIKLDNTTYFLLPSKNRIKYDIALEDHWESVCDQFPPDVVHIHGTEYAHGLACMRKFPNLKYVVSIQGLVSVCSNYFYAGISFWEILKNITFRDVVKRDTLFQARKNFKKRGLIEREYIERTKHVIGRTKWDFAHVKVINMSVKYHFCNESLRDGFYSAKKWSINNCRKNTIFLSQAGYPIKGLHQVIKAVAILRKEFPDLKIRLGGSNITKQIYFKDKIKLSGYGKFICALLNRHALGNEINFLGALSEGQMISEYQKAQVFICPSSIENSPNSLGEAQILGVPVIAAYVGGVPDMIDDGKTGLLYRFEEVEMLVANVRSVLNLSDLSLQLSENGIKTASLRHDRKKNLDSTLVIYNAINESD